MKKYSWSFDEYAEWWEGEGDTVEECIQQALEECEYNKEYSEFLYIYENKIYIPTINAEQVLFEVEDDIYGYLNGIIDVSLGNHDRIKELEEDLNQAFYKWMEKCGSSYEFVYGDYYKTYKYTGETYVEL